MAVDFAKILTKVTIPQLEMIRLENSWIRITIRVQEFLNGIFTIIHWDSAEEAAAFAEVYDFRVFYLFVCLITLAYMSDTWTNLDA